MSTSRSSYAAATTAVVIIVLPLLYMASIPVCFKILCEPRATGGWPAWTFAKPPPSWLALYTSPLSRAFKIPTIHEVVGPCYSNYAAWVYGIKQ